MTLEDAVPPPPPAKRPGDNVGIRAEGEMELVREGVVAPESVVPAPPELPPVEKVPPVEGVESPIAVVGVAPPPNEWVDPAAKEGVCAALPMLGVLLTLAVGKKLVDEGELEVEKDDTPCVAVPFLGGEGVS